MEALQILKSCGEILISHPKAENVFLFIHQTNSVKHHLTETHEHNFDTHNIMLSSKVYR